MKNKSVKSLLLAAGFLLCTACSTSPKTQVVQIGDNQLSKQEIIAELKKLDVEQAKIDKKKGVTGTNIASVLLWWPGIAYTYYDASEATKLIEQRRTHLSNMYNQKYGSSKKA